MKLTTIALAILLIIGCMAGYVYMTEPITTYVMTTNGTLLNNGTYLLTNETQISGVDLMFPASPSAHRDSIIYTDMDINSVSSIINYTPSDGNSEAILTSMTYVSQCDQSGKVIVYIKGVTFYEAVYYHSKINQTSHQIGYGVANDITVHEELIAYTEVYGADYSVKVYDTSGRSNPPLLLNITEHESSTTFGTVRINTNGTTICYIMRNSTTDTYYAKEHGIYNDFSRTIGSTHKYITSFEEEELFYTYYSGGAEKAEVMDTETSAIIWSDGNSSLSSSTSWTKSEDWALYSGEVSGQGRLFLVNVRTNETVLLHSTRTTLGYATTGHKLYQYTNGTLLITYEDEDTTAGRIYMRYLINFYWEEESEDEESEYALVDWRTTSRAEQLEEGFEETTGVSGEWVWVLILMTIIISAYAYYRYRKPKYKEI